MLLNSGYWWRRPTAGFRLKLTGFVHLHLFSVSPHLIMKQNIITCVPTDLSLGNLSYFNVLIHQHLGARDRQKIL